MQLVPMRRPTTPSWTCACSATRRVGTSLASCRVSSRAAMWGIPMVAIHRAARITISGPDDVLAQADGELIGGLPLGISVVLRALRVLVAG